MIAAPNTSPWGKVEEARYLGSGAWSVSTGRHGGILLDAVRTAAMPGWMQAASYTGASAYEEDCDWSLVALRFPELFDGCDIYLALRIARQWHASDELTGFLGGEGLAAVAVADAWRRSHAADWLLQSTASMPSSAPRGAVYARLRNIGDGSEWALWLRDHPPRVIDTQSLLGLRLEPDEVRAG